MTDHKDPPIVPVLLVAGLECSGISMVMGMLDAGGMRVTGHFPSYNSLSEPWSPPRQSEAVIAGWVAAQGGCAVKWLNPVKRMFKRDDFATPPVIIMLVRDPYEQACSQLDDLAAHGMVAVQVDAVGQALMRTIQRDVPRMRERLEKLGEVHEFRFEDVLNAPLQAASRLSEIVAEHFEEPFDTGAAARAVHGGKR